VLQDTWVVFYNRWRAWSFEETPGEPTGRPILSFLYRTMQFVLRGYRRKHRRDEPIENTEISNGHSHSTKMQTSVELGQLLEIARKACPPEELEVLMGKLAGLQGAEIATALGTTAAIVDHRFRNAIARLQKHAGVPVGRRIHHAK
jgi:DNA-directed RNA polymerase specialized sigma24 family protein